MFEISVTQNFIVFYTSVISRSIVVVPDDGFSLKVKPAQYINNYYKLISCHEGDPFVRL